MPDTKTVHTLIIPGKTEITWDTNDNESVIKAQQAFDQAKQDGLMSYAITPGSGSGSQGEVIRNFDPTVDIRMQTQTAGG